jgi:hypothetical protein
MLDMIDRTDWILTVDYDSVFEAEAVTRLMTAALVSGYDAVAPLQTKRDDGVPMFTPEGHGHKIGLVELPNTWFEAVIQPVETAHFGLTLIRSSALKKPQPRGSWARQRPTDTGATPKKAKTTESILTFTSGECSGQPATNWASPPRWRSATQNSRSRGPVGT